MDKQESDELRWRAFQYLAQELEESDRQAFERQLETDQLAREALAHAVELTDCLVALGSADPAMPSLSGPVVSSGWLQTVMGAALGAALCLLVVMTTLSWWGDTLADVGSEAAHETSENENRAEALATLWSETRGSFDEPAWSEPDAEEPALSDDSMLLGSEHSEWIYAAVAGMAADESLATEAEQEGTL